MIIFSIDRANKWSSNRNLQTKRQSTVSSLGSREKHWFNIVGVEFVLYITYWKIFGLWCSAALDSFCGYHFCGLVWLLEVARKAVLSHMLHGHKRYQLAKLT